MSEKKKAEKQETAEATTEEETKETGETGKRSVSIDEAADEFSAKQSDAKIAELEDKYLRLLAEYDNYRKRSVKEREGIYAEAYADAIGTLLPVIDNMERAMQYSEGDKLAEGIRMILSTLPDVLSKMGITEIETKTFDPNVHNAVMHVEDETKGEGEIVEVFEKGYRRGDRIIRCAMVKVAN